MRKSKFTVEEILAILGDLDCDPVAAVAHRHDVSKQTIYGWKKRFGSAKELRGESNWDSLKLYLGQPLGSDLEDFCAVHFGAPEIDVVREAVRTFIADRLAHNPELNKRFDKAQQDHTEKQNQESSEPPFGISTRPSGFVLP
jgi:hypothetical protein